jgi:S1-C subfamily serine protease
MGKPLEMSFLRYDAKGSKVDRETITVPTDQLGNMEKIEQTDSWFGFEVGGITNLLADKLGVSIDGGVVIEKIARGSEADSAGLTTSDLIVSINQNPVQTMGDFRRLRHSLQAESSVLFRVRRGNKMADVMLGKGGQQEPARPRRLGM